MCPINIGIVKSGKTNISEKARGRLVKFKFPSIRVCLIRAEKIESETVIVDLLLYNLMFSLTINFLNEVEKVFRAI